ncbi:hypothetical protein CYV19_07455 [Natronobacterium gregoryi SP2]|uniref:Uncharacterized protein n=1 Tax=Natronobacterium gregoryi (strain ATCC 43098 / DSM 3393 / CCM 3738 / CIP 104747 / IAM 13177 / JCM 8860 / NBRC 102187 / NCIMB 2189 / SP2) TaxID=797304 RepID=A0A2J4JG71_NATGS|nr:hypothetical protein CYV19_07455 [Natronobacterium gregoryi SP2]
MLAHNDHLVVSMQWPADFENIVINSWVERILYKVPGTRIVAASHHCQTMHFRSHATGDFPL